MPACPAVSVESAAGCTLCPRRCGAERTLQDPGRCGAAEPPGFFRVARLMAHHWEEPWISGSRGSGAVCFSGCSLGCCFCQNASISLRRQGTVLSQDRLIGEIGRLLRQGVHNLNLVTAGHYASQIPDLVSQLRRLPEWTSQGQPLPVVWNSSGYETEAALLALAKTANVFLPDFKYADPNLSAAMAQADDYFAVASRAILMMHRLQPKTVLSDSGIILRGLVVRHLVLPGHWR
ncbi:MAG TPA: radical SAM protein, partial [Clostridiales bacterium]|nr:radical SAM protein [Clostridiales bacterium]